MTLPQLDADLFICDGGLETSLIYLAGIDLPDFAAFPLLEDDAGRQALTDYYAPYLDLAARLGVGIVLDTPTWRASLDWTARLGYDANRLAAVNRDAVAFIADLAQGQRDVQAVINGVVGPRGDGYVAGQAMTPAESASYHALQARAFAEAGAAMMSAVTMTNSAEAIGVTMAAQAAGLAVVVSFTVETDGSLPSGEKLADAIRAVDQATDAGPAYYMVNCAHPTHIAPALEAGAEWTARIKGVRANASAMSHEELDASTELDRGDPADLAERHITLRQALPELRVVGGCCGTDLEHVEAIAGALLAPGA